MEIVRDLAQAEPWRESLDRSHARRTPRGQPSSRRNGLGPAADAPHTPPDLRRKAAKRRRRLVARATNAVAAILLVAFVLPGALDGRASPVSPSSAHAGVLRRAHASAHVGLTIPTGGAVHLARKGTCPMAIGPMSYINPLTNAKVKPERIDQGVDYAGAGTLAAMGRARIANVATDGAGWPGTFIDYELLTGPDAGCYVYYAEGVTPEPGLLVGETVSAGQPLATIIPDYPSGIEIGWAAGTGTKTYAGLTSPWTANEDYDNVATWAGKRFSEMISSLGGRPGKVEG